MTFIYCHLQGNPNSSGLQFEVAYWPAVAVGGEVGNPEQECFTIEVAYSGHQNWYGKSTPFRATCKSGTEVTVPAV